MADAPDRGPATRISWRTVVLASCGSVAAAFVVSALWAPGTLIGAAVTPMIVALTSELLRKPIEAVPSPGAALSPLLPGARGAGPPPDVQEHDPPTDPGPVVRGSARGAAAAGPGGPGAAAAAGPGAPETVVRQYPRSDHRTWDRARIRIALLTALLAFGIAVAFFVLADLTTGSAITGGGGSSSLFSPDRHRSSVPASTTTTPAKTTTQQTTTPGSATQPQGTTTVPPRAPATTPQTTPATPAPAPAPAPTQPQQPQQAPSQGTTTP